MASAKPRKGTKFRAPKGAAIPEGTVVHYEQAHHGRVYLSWHKEPDPSRGGGISAPQFLSVTEADFKKWKRP